MSRWPQEPPIPKAGERASPKSHRKPLVPQQQEDNVRLVHATPPTSFEFWCQKLTFRSLFRRPSDFTKKIETWGLTHRFWQRKPVKDEKDIFQDKCYRQLAIPLADHGFHVSLTYNLSDVGVKISIKNRIFQTDNKRTENPYQVFMRPKFWRKNLTNIV